MFKTQEEMWQAVENLINSLEQSGNQISSQLICDGYKALNGLTDGWIDFLEAIKKVQKEINLSDSQKQLLQRIHETAYFAVYRKELKQWWKFW